MYNCLQNANASSFSNDKFTISGNGSVTFYLAIYDHFAICSFFIEVDILLQTKAENNGPENAISGCLSGGYFSKFFVRSAPTDGGAPLR